MGYEAHEGGYVRQLYLYEGKKTRNWRFIELELQTRLSPIYLRIESVRRDDVYSEVIARVSQLGDNLT